MVSMRSPESETTKLSVPVAVRVPLPSQTAPLQLPPLYRLKLSVPDPVVGSNEVVVPTTVRVWKLKNFAPESRPPVSVMTSQEFPAASRVVCKIALSLAGTSVGTGETELQSIRAAPLKQTV